ncbi:MAG: hypothetical protein M1301_01630 [Candidatus Thermoplasmatota archaeon]|nr:hypothetical protein [Candidatus Thermoplasmatota archaeon]
MKDETIIRSQKSTLVEHRKRKALGEFSSHDAFIQYLMKAYPVNAPQGEVVK